MIDKEFFFRDIDLKVEKSYIFAALSGILFVTLFNYCLSPFYPRFLGADSSFFMTVGRGILEGKIPYKDYCDVKGPLFFFFQALGQHIYRGRFGMYLLDCICAACSAVFLLRLCKLYELSRNKIFVAFVFYYLIYVSTSIGGNSVEEYILPLNMLCLFLGVRFLRGMNKSLWVSVIFGICFGVCLFSKVTLAASLCAIAVTVVFSLIIEKNYKGICICALLFLGGLAIVSIPVIAYFYANDSLGDMLLWCFRIAFARSTDYKYLTDAGTVFGINWEILLIPCYVSVIAGVIRIKKKDIIGVLMIAEAVVSYVLLHLGSAFQYYMLLLLPLIALLAVNYLSDIANIYEEVRTDTEKKSFMKNIYRMLAFSFGMVAIFYAYSNPALGNLDVCLKNKINDKGKKMYAYYQYVGEMIPDEERDDVFCMSGCCRFFEANGMLPANRYPLNIMYWGNVYLPSKQETLDELNSKKHKWVYHEITDGTFTDEEIEEAFYSNYDQYLDFESVITLWVAKGEED